MEASSQTNNKEKIENNNYSKDIKIIVDEKENKIVLNSSQQGELLVLTKKREEDVSIILKNDFYNENHNNSENKNSNKSTSIERQDISEENSQILLSNGKYNNENKKTIKDKIL